MQPNLGDTPETHSSKLTLVAAGAVDRRAEKAAELLFARSGGKRGLFVVFCSTEAFKRAFTREFQKRAGRDDRLIVENARSRRIRGAEDIARRVWFYTRLGARTVLVENYRDEAAAAVVEHLGGLVARESIPVVLLAGEMLARELSNGWRLAFLCTQAAQGGRVALIPEQVERVPVESDGTQAEPARMGEPLHPGRENLRDGFNGLLGAPLPVPQLGLQF